MFFTKRKEVQYSLPFLDLRKLLFLYVQYVFHGLKDIEKHSDIFAYAKCISFYAGELYPEFYENPFFLKSIKQSLSRGCKIQVLFGSALYVDSVNFLKLACSTDNIKLYRRSWRDSAHFKIIEDINGDVLALIDERHEISIKEDDRESALLIRGYGTEIDFLKEKFKKELTDAEPIGRNNIIKEFSDRKKENDQFYGFITLKNGKVQLASDDQIKHLEKELKKQSNLHAKSTIVEYVNENLTGGVPESHLRQRSSGA
jgi:hypothetical protein